MKHLNPKPLKVSELKLNMLVAFSTPYTPKVILRASKINKGYSVVEFQYDSLTREGYAGELRQDSKGLFKVNSVKDGESCQWSP